MVCTPKNVTEKESECNTIQSTAAPITITSFTPITTNEKPKEQITSNNTVEIQEKSTTDGSLEECKILPNDNSSNKPAEIENKSINHPIAPTSQMITAVEHDEQVRVYGS